jgi:serralysin
LAGVTVNLDSTGAQNTGGAGIDTLLNMERVIGSSFNDTLTGAASGVSLVNNTLDGGAGNDVLSSGDFSDSVLNGGAGNDTLTGAEHGGHVLNGGSGDDTLRAAGGGNTLNGGDGNDILSGGGLAIGAVLNGGAGNDTLTLEEGILNGGTGADTINPGLYASIDYNSVNDSPAGAGRDHILGFISEGPGGDVDARIDLRDIDANTIASGNQAFSFIGSAGFTAAGQLRYAGEFLQGNTDADATAEFEIQLVGAPTLVIGGTGTDILL